MYAYENEKIAQQITKIYGKAAPVAHAAFSPFRIGLTNNEFHSFC